MNFCRGSRVSSNIFEEKFWFREVEALRVDELRIRVWKLLAVAHFEEAVEENCAPYDVTLEMDNILGVYQV